MNYKSEGKHVSIETNILAHSFNPRWYVRTSGLIRRAVSEWPEVGWDPPAERQKK